MSKSNKQYGSSSSHSAFAQHQQQQSSQSSSTSSGDHPHFTSICELANAVKGKQSLVLKLTDECSEALKRAIKARLPVRMHVRKEGVLIEMNIGESEPMVFKCAEHKQADTDSICFDSKQKLFRNIGQPTAMRLQVQATASAFAELKEKTQKLTAAEQQKKAKDISKSQKTATQRKSAIGPSKMDPTTTTQRHKSLQPHSSLLAKLAGKRTHSPSPSANPSRINTPTPPPPKQFKMEMSANPSRKSTPTPPPPKQFKMETKQYVKSVPPLSVAVPHPVVHHHPFYVPAQQQQKNLLIGQQHHRGQSISPPFPLRPNSVDSTLQHSSSCSPDDLGSLTMPTAPTRDWHREFGKVGTADEARRFLSIFKNEYPEYRRCYEMLMQVRDDFCALKSSLDKAKGDEYQRVAKVIRDKYAGMQMDGDFMTRRQRHTDLRAKLEAIKLGLEEWNSNRLSTA